MICELYPIFAALLSTANVSRAFHLCRGVEVETRPARLGLARVSMIRGEGPTLGTSCIDDYIRPTEPVVDYLTKFSGLVAGDLDPLVSAACPSSPGNAYLRHCAHRALRTVTR